MRVLFFKRRVFLVDMDLVYAFKKRGVEVLVEDLQQSLTPEGHIMETFSLERIRDLLDTFKPDIVLTMNGSGLDNDGIISQEYERRKIPFLTWFLDRPLQTDIGNRYVKENSHLFTFDKIYIKGLEEAGFRSVHYLPLATNPDRFRPLYGLAHEKKVCFIGELDYKTIQYLTRNIDAMVEGADENFYLCIESAIQEQMKGVGRDTWQIIDESLKRGGEDTTGFPQIFRDLLEGFVERESGLRLRLETMKAVSERFPVAVYGDELWEKVMGGRFLGKVNYFNDEVVQAYNRYAIQVNISKFQLRTTINQRPFDVSASGGFLITDIRDDLYELFSPDEMVSFKDTQDLLEKIDVFINDEKLRKEYVQRARRRVLAEHTYDNRVDRMLEIVRG